jgi:hypothetical protein
MQISVTAQKVETVKVTIHHEELLNKTIELIRTRHKIPLDAWIEKGNVCINDPDWRHGSVSTEIVREASETDKEAIKVMQYLSDLSRAIRSGN